MHNKLFNKFVILFLLFGPIFDVITSFQIRNDIDFMSIGVLLRGIFFLITIVYLIKNNYGKKGIIIFILYFLLEIMHTLIHTENDLIKEVLNVIKIFYLPILIFFFYKYENKNIDDKLIFYIYLIYLNFIIVPYIFNTGYSLYKPAEHKGGYLGLFYSGNELSAIFIGLLPIVLNYVINSKNYILKLLFYIELLIVVMLLGTKTMFLGVIIVFWFYIIKYFINKYKIIKTKLKYLFFVIPIMFTILIILILPKTVIYKNFKIAKDYYKINTVSDALSINAVDKLIFSNRLTYLKNINEIYINQDKYAHLYGIGVSQIAKNSELDIFDIFYSIGVFGFTIWIIIIILSMKNVNLKHQYKFSLVLFILMSLVSGHVLCQPMVSIFIALLVILNKNSIKIDKKNILLVSNMYPSKKYKHYGSFVKNTKELLEANNFNVDIVVMYKQDSKIKKLFSYINLYLKTIIKGIFNNYDYIYVHYISHSTLGAILPKITSKNTKLILNVHGNDVVPDLDNEKKNIKRSKKYLKYADHVIVPSNYFKKLMIKIYSLEDDKMTVYPSGGVNTSLFKKKNKEEAKKSCGLDVNKHYIGYVSRIEKNKGYDVFLKAIKELEKENKIGNKKFLIVGSGSEEPIMKDLIKELDIDKYLEIRNLVSQEELVDIYNSLDLFIFPTYRYSESLGLVGLEAMACEIFVIASKNFGPTDYLIDNKNGFFFEPKNEVDLKNKILKYENLNDEQKEKIVKKARETAIKYDVKNTKNQILKVFK